MAGCGLAVDSRAQWCRDAVAATHLKWISIGIILFTSAVGISSPVVLARLFEGKPAYTNALLLIKCFAAGVILATSLVHVLPDAFDALADCQLASRHPWRDFPSSAPSSPSSAPSSPSSSTSPPPPTPPLPPAISSTPLSGSRRRERRRWEGTAEGGGGDGRVPRRP